ncbi:MAG: hypothetical protein LH614_18985 [Pyrinomonadaceae bacterium]|nr:hypothetical protein [Pyrinomonadaceae bacterium]
MTGRRYLRRAKQSRLSRSRPLIVMFRLEKQNKLQLQKDTLQIQLQKIEQQIAEQSEIEDKSSKLGCLPRRASIESFEKLKYIYDLHKNGKTFQELAQSFDVSVNRIRFRIDNAEMRWGNSYLATLRIGDDTFTTEIKAMNLERAKRILKNQYSLDIVIVNIEEEI